MTSSVHQLCARVLLAAAVLAAAPGAADAACKTITVAKGHTYVHGTVAHLFDTPKLRVASAQSSDDWHPNSPAWFADATNVAFSVQVATMQLARRWMNEAKGKKGEGTTAPLLSLFWYHQANPMTFTECDTPWEAVAHTLKITNGKDRKKVLDGSADPQLLTGKNFCAHQRTVKPASARQDGYIILKDAVRKEKEYIMCKASLKSEFPALTRTKCTVHVKQPPAGRPTLYIHCGTKAYSRYYSWNLNAPGMWSGFKVETGPPETLPTDGPPVPKFVQLAASVGKKNKKSKAKGKGGALQPSAGGKKDSGLPPKGDFDSIQPESLDQNQHELLTKAFQAIVQAEATLVAKTKKK